ncbi:MAG: hypothetical protein QXP36_07585, partial [Conexivisphaerales archaeon]
MMIKKTMQGISSFSTVPHKTAQLGNIHPFSHQPITTTQERITSHPLLTKPTKQEIYPAHPIGMPNMSFYKEKQNQGVSTTKQPTSQPTFTTGPLILNPFAKRSG